MLPDPIDSAPSAAAGLVVRRWTRHGHDRLYVRTVDGVSIGYRDNRTGAVVATGLEHQDALLAALQQADAVSAAGPEGRTPAMAVTAVEPQSQPEPEPEPEPEPVVYREMPTPPKPTLLPVPAAVPAPVAHSDLEPVAGPARMPAPAPIAEPAGDPWTDLSTTAAGAAARARAIELRQAAPVRTFLSRALGLKTDERAWRIGADGEEAVAKELRALGTRWRVLHAVPVGKQGSDIDHVVIGPGGVFTVNTKHHPHAKVWVGGNTVMVNGARVPYVRNSRFEATRAGRMLAKATGGEPVPVTGVIAVMRCADFVVKSAPDPGVVVTTRRRLTQWLTKRPEVLSDERVAELYDVARRADTWH